MSIFDRGRRWRSLGEPRTCGHVNLQSSRADDQTILNVGDAWLPFINEKLRNETRGPRVDAPKGYDFQMTSRDELIKREALELWNQMHDEPPPEVDGGTLLEIICRDMHVQDYDRVRSPFLRPTMILRPEEWPEARKG